MAIYAVLPSPEPETVSVVTDSADLLGANLLSVGKGVLPIAATLLAITVGWRFARKFVKG